MRQGLQEAVARKVEERLEGLLEIGLFFQLSKISPVPVRLYQQIWKDSSKQSVGASLEAFSTPQRGQPMWMSMSPVPSDGTVGSGRTI